MDITITIPNAQVQRVRDAFTQALLLPEGEQASLADVKGYILNDLKQFVRNAEKQAARLAAESAVTDIDPT